MKKMLIYVLSLFGLVGCCPADVITAVLVMEARDEGWEGMAAVMSVIDNRAKGNPSKWEDVVKQKKQFSCLNHVLNGPVTIKRFISVAKGKAGWQDAKGIVRNARAGVLIDFTWGATHYHADYIKDPRWADPAKITTKIGKHLFYKL